METRPPGSFFFVVDFFFASDFIFVTSEATHFPAPGEWPQCARRLQQQQQPPNERKGISNSNRFFFFFFFSVLKRAFLHFGVERNGRKTKKTRWQRRGDGSRPNCRTPFCFLSFWIMFSRHFERKGISNSNRFFFFFFCSKTSVPSFWRRKKWKENQKNALATSRWRVASKL